LTRRSAAASPRGATVHVEVSFDSTTSAVTIVERDDTVYKRYYGADLTLEVAGNTLSGTDPATTYIDVVTSALVHTVQVIAMRGFASGRVAGLSIDFFQLGLRVTPTRHPDASLPTRSSAFEAAIAEGPFAVVLKHHDNANYWQFGAVAPGPMTSGQITAVR